MKNGNHENCVFYTASELDKHIPDSPGQQLTMTGVAGLKEIEDGKLHRIASPASKAFNESCPRRLLLLMSLLPFRRNSVIKINHFQKGIQID